jgi:hypothetical protein
MKTSAYKRFLVAPQSIQLFSPVSLSRILIFNIMLCTLALSAQVGVHTDFPDNSSAMDIVATDKGLLIPRVTLSNDLTDPSPVTAPAVGLLVFNDGLNQPLGFYYWDGVQWVELAGGGGVIGDYWELQGNSGTIIGTHFLGTTDDEPLAIYTNNTERMRFENDAQVAIGNPGAFYVEDLLTVQGNATNNSAINAYSPLIGMYTESSRAGFQTWGGRYGLIAQVDSSNGFSVYARNYDPLGNAIITAGANSPAYTINSHSCGVASSGESGVFGFANSATGNGFIGIGSAGDTAFMSPTGSGGSFTGYNGCFARARNSSGTGVIGAGNNVNAMSMADGSGGAFTGPTTGLISFATNASGSTGVIGIGNNAAITTLAAGTGGAFKGYHGLITVGNNATGFGLISIGNDGASYATTANGAGGSLTGYHGVLALGTNASSGIGFLGSGNNLAPTIPGGGCGGAFTGAVIGAQGFSNSSANNSAGGYFQNGGATSYAYIGCRFSNQNRKVSGNGVAGTIVKNTKGELIEMSCPEAPETVFHDYGIGQLVNGKAHISIDPDLAININICAEHPLKVFITPEGDCNGVYVTNKSAQGFDVIELQGGKSNVQFSWQIVATRANELYTLKDGTVEISDYSQRFPPGPGPMEILQQSSSGNHESEMGAVQYPEVFEIKPVKQSIEQVNDPAMQNRKKKLND